ncbi:MAG: LicD family protein [Mycoplasma sp.]|nr:LicD family protein [Mycoplasma sp.]
MEMKKIVDIENLKWFEYFAKVCEENNIWYTVDNGTLLGTIRHKGVIPWDDDFDVSMTIESYEKLKSLFPENCIDGTMTKDYPLVIPKFVPDNKKFLESAIFVDIFLIVPTNIKKIKKYRSFKNKSKFSIQCVHSTWKPYAWYIYILTIISWPIKFFLNKITYKSSIKQLMAKKDFTCFYTIDNPVDPIKHNKIINFSYKRMKMPFETFEVFVPKEYEEILTNKYTKNYMTPKVDSRPFIHLNAVSVRKKTKEEIKEYNLYEEKHV